MECTENTFITHDHTELFYRHWQGSSDKAIILFHRGHEHGGRMAHLVDELGMPECHFFAWDARGHGQSPGKRGDSPGFEYNVADIQSFVEYISKTYGIATENMVVVAQSVGAVLAATWAHDYAPKIRGMVLASPAFDIKLYVPLAIPGLRLAHALFGNFFVNSYVKAHYLTHDKARAESYNSDPLITRPISVNMLLGVFDGAKRVVADAAAITIPTQMLVSGSDFVVYEKPQRRFFDKLGTAHKEYHVLPGFYHDTLGEQERHLATDKMRRFITNLFDNPLQTIDLTQADRRGYTCSEAEALATPVPAGSIKDKYWHYYRKAFAWLGQRSEGIRLGFELGFDSGSTLDYVYRNKPSGDGLFGKFVDYCYLNSVGWRGIRQRKVNLETSIKQVVKQLQDDGKPVRLMDVAAGHGRYVLEAVQSLNDKPEAVLLRDFSDVNVTDGQALIDNMGLANIAKFEQGDAFDKQALSNIELKPNLVIVSGLYELFADNTMLQNSLAGIAAAMDEDGYLIYTGQPWHPQLELIARSLTSHKDGNAWVMRRRTQAEMDQLVEQAGFEKCQQKIDQFGIFTVSIAKKRSQ
uniref:bifunctional alpha/beta hydrolase/class I SAM-dependent methyltransferase n=1 Tax=Thaumasiovibrio occultus TaxID=1891184 RepID=UPI000B351F7F|nr:bifunctional alpha/beta hydrolase/class I SAM-dependent methyltransferase [Thaumasiovibrio occultus]